MDQQKKYSKEGNKRQHLSFEDRQNIEYDYNHGVKVSEISKKLGKHRTTIEREIKLGLHETYDYNIPHSWDGKVVRYSAKIAQSKRDFANTNKGTKLKIEKYKNELEELEKLIKIGYSPYAALQKVKIDICVKTLYNYLDKDIFLTISNKDLLYKKRKKKRDYHKIKRKAKNNLDGKSISKRPKKIDERKEMGHWEIDLVVGKRGSKRAVLTLVERVSRKSIYVLIKNKTQKEVINALKRIKRQYQGDFSEVFKTITADNGIEFLDNEGMKRAIKCGEIYYAHPYSSWERGSNENGNRFLRRFFPKGTDFGAIPLGELKEVEDFINNYPRKILGGKSANQVFNELVA